MTDTAAEPKSVRVVIEVLAGVIPERPEPEHTRRWVLTSEQWHGTDDTGKAVLLAELNGRALGYAGLLMLQPRTLNWVRANWLWL
jgi:hypothetical protein